ncbi:hypothetical protein [Sporanaerobacter sp. PP17-6a]|uniref:hypothetical protein n=1 Tax=Sporanaerobacter sp. PP17-6a TaxID=1891289 RepID=UPI0008A00EF5|nr:hypothetical protein [Sporanaerobacter sp. PP17-6a]SCL85117.1 hypothetical protein PP176A_0808 [Sporanaerobacter sp. PP17-6a]
MINSVIAGDYKGYVVKAGFNSVSLCNWLKKIKLSKDIVENYEIINTEYRKSAASGAARGIIGGALLGGAGLIAGSISGKNKGKYQITIQFKDGKRSLLELDDLTYKMLMQVIF